MDHPPNHLRPRPEAIQIPNFAQNFDSIFTEADESDHFYEQILAVNHSANILTYLNNIQEKPKPEDFPETIHRSLDHLIADAQSFHTLRSDQRQHVVAAMLSVINHPHARAIPAEDFYRLQMTLSKLYRIEAVEKNIFQTCAPDRKNPKSRLYPFAAEQRKEIGFRGVTFLNDSFDEKGQLFTHQAQHFKKIGDMFEGVDNQVFFPLITPSDAYVATQQTDHQLSFLTLPFLKSYDNIYWSSNVGQNHPEIQNLVQRKEPYYPGIVNDQKERMYVGMHYLQDLAYTNILLEAVINVSFYLHSLNSKNVRLCKPESQEYYDCLIKNPIVPERELFMEAVQMVCPAESPCPKISIKIDQSNIVDQSPVRSYVDLRTILIWLGWKKLNEIPSHRFMGLYEIKSYFDTFVEHHNSLEANIQDPVPYQEPTMHMNGPTARYNSGEDRRKEDPINQLHAQTVKNHFAMAAQHFPGNLVFTSALQGRTRSEGWALWWERWNVTVLPGGKVVPWMRKEFTEEKIIENAAKIRLHDWIEEPAQKDRILSNPSLSQIELGLMQAIIANVRMVNEHHKLYGWNPMKPEIPWTPTRTRYSLESKSLELGRLMLDYPKGFSRAFLTQPKTAELLCPIVDVLSLDERSVQKAEQGLDNALLTISIVSIPFTAAAAISTTGLTTFQRALIVALSGSAAALPLTSQDLKKMTQSYRELMKIRRQLLSVFNDGQQINLGEISALEDLISSHALSSAMGVAFLGVDAAGILWTTSNAMVQLFRNLNKFLRVELHPLGFHKILLSAKEKFQRLSDLYHMHAQRLLPDFIMDDKYLFFNLVEDVNYETILEEIIRGRDIKWLKENYPHLFKENRLRNKYLFNPIREGIKWIKSQKDLIVQSLQEFIETYAPMFASKEMFWKMIMQPDFYYKYKIWNLKEFRIRFLAKIFSSPLDSPTKVKKIIEWIEYGIEQKNITIQEAQELINFLNEKSKYTRFTLTQVAADGRAIANSRYVVRLTSDNLATSIASIVTMPVRTAMDVVLLTNDLAKTYHYSLEACTHFVDVFNDTYRRAYGVENLLTIETIEGGFAIDATRRIENSQARSVFETLKNISISERDGLALSDDFQKVFSMAKIGPGGDMVASFVSDEVLNLTRTIEFNEFQSISRLVGNADILRNIEIADFESALALYRLINGRSMINDFYRAQMVRQIQNLTKSKSNILSTKAKKILAHLNGSEISDEHRSWLGVLHRAETLDIDYEDYEIFKFIIEFASMEKTNHSGIRSLVNSAGRPFNAGGLVFEDLAPTRSGLISPGNTTNSMSEILMDGEVFQDIFASLRILKKYEERIRNATPEAIEEFEVLVKAIQNTSTSKYVKEIVKYRFRLMNNFIDHYEDLVRAGMNTEQAASEARRRTANFKNLMRGCYNRNDSVFSRYAYRSYKGFQTVIGLPLGLLGYWIKNMDKEWGSPNPIDGGATWKRFYITIASSFLGIYIATKIHIAKDGGFLKKVLLDTGYSNATVGLVTNQLTFFKQVYEPQVKEILLDMHNSGVISLEEIAALKKMIVNSPDLIELYGKILMEESQENVIQTLENMDTEFFDQGGKSIDIQATDTEVIIKNMDGQQLVHFVSESGEEYMDEFMELIADNFYDTMSELREPGMPGAPFGHPMADLFVFNTFMYGVPSAMMSLYRNQTIYRLMCNNLLMGSQLMAVMPYFIYTMDKYFKNGYGFNWLMDNWGAPHLVYQKDKIDDPLEDQLFGFSSKKEREEKTALLIEELYGNKELFSDFTP
ncbi:MAG: hypothetical protein R3A11_04315 [Bdellovibrionota bacterium]